jgi:hypothetical protein
MWRTMMLGETEAVAELAAANRAYLDDDVVSRGRGRQCAPAPVTEPPY